MKNQVLKSLIIGIFFILFCFFTSTQIIADEDHIQVGGTVWYNDFGSHFSRWNGATNGGTVYLKLNGNIIGQCYIGSDGSFFITASPADQSVNLTLATSSLEDGSGSWIGGANFYHTEGIIDDISIYALPY